MAVWPTAHLQGASQSNPGHILVDRFFYSPFLKEADVRGAAVPQSSGLPGPTQGSRRCPVRLGVTSDLFQCLDPVTQVAF